MKKQYITPSTECIEMELTQIIAGSDVNLGGDTTPEEWGRENNNTDEHHNKPNIWDQVW